MAESEEERTVAIRYKRAPQFRLCHADGAFGGWTSSRNLHLEFYEEHAAYPDMVLHAVTPEGGLGEEKKRRGETGIVRERECGVVMSVQSAIRLRDWLTRKLEEGEEAGLFQIQSNESRDE